MSRDDVIRSFYDKLVEDFGRYRLSQPQRLAVERQMSRFHKRWADNVDRQMLATRALDNFISVNREASKVNLSIDPEIVNNARDFILHALHKYSSLVGGVSVTDNESKETRWYYTSPQTTFDFQHVMRLWRFGPGASTGIEGTHFVEKLPQMWTCTSKSLNYVKLLRRLTPSLRHYDNVSVGPGAVRVVKHSKMTTVPKNAETDRTICTEPLGNMALQLAAGTYLEGVLRCIGIDIKTQEDKNKTLAYKGSINGTLSTIDLKNASDMITLSLVRLLLPSDLYTFLVSIRSPRTMVKYPDGTQIDVKLHMISTMGNGFTFPLMTLIITALCYAVECEANKRGKRHYLDFEQWGVYGDDIVCPSTHFTLMCNTLSAAGLVVNTDKSFSTGRFRESCGGDYVGGYNITPFYPTSLRRDTDVYVVMNQLTKWAARHNLVPAKSFQFLISLLRRDFLCVPEWESDDSGYRTPSPPAPFYDKMAPLSPKVKIKGNHYHPRLFLLAVLGGYIDGGFSGRHSTYTPRINTTRYIRVRRVALPSGNCCSGVGPTAQSEIDPDDTFTVCRRSLARVLSTLSSSPA